MDTVLETTDPPGSPRPRSFAQTIIHNTLATSAGAGVIKLLNFGFSILAIRLLGEVGWGQYATVLAFVGLFSVAFELGLTQYAERSIAQDASRSAELFANLVALRMLLALPALLLLPLLAWALSYPALTVLGVALVSATFLLAAVLAPLTSVLNANERFDVTAGLAVINQLVTVVVGLLLLWQGWGLLALLSTGFITMPLQIGLSLRAIKRLGLGPLPLRPSPATWPAFLRAALPFGLTSLALTLNFHADTALLSLFHPAAVVGWYSVAYGLIFSLVGLTDGFLGVLTPSLAREHMSAPERTLAWAQAAIRWLLIIALPAAVGLALTAPRLIELVYGAAFAPSGPLLALLAWDVPLLLFTALCGNLTAAIGLERPAARIYALGVGLNVVLNLLLIPAFGATAAAGITLLTDAVCMLGFVLLLRQPAGLGALLPTLARSGLAALVMGGCVWLAGALPLAATIAVGAVSYALLALVFGLISPGRWRS